MKKFNYTSLLAKADWMPILGITVLSIIILSIIAPAFLTRTNLFVMLRILSVTSIVAMAQMIVIGLGQMNLAVGAIGGLVAILFGGMMEVYGIPVPVAALIGLLIGVVCGFINGLNRFYRNQRIYHYAGHDVDLYRSQLRHHRIDPLLPHA
jgi:ribose transport system permease protein